MKRFVLSLPLLSLLALLSACDIGDATQAVTSGVVGTTIDATKGVAEGVTEGIKEGRKDARSADGSIVLSEPEEVFKLARISVLEVAPHGSGQTRVTLAVENRSEQPVHLIGLDGNGGAMLIDQEGFSTPISSRSNGQLNDAIVVPPMAKIKEDLVFQGEAATAAKVRLWNKNLPVPQPQAPVLR